MFLLGRWVLDFWGTEGGHHFGQQKTVKKSQDGKNQTICMIFSRTLSLSQVAFFTLKRMSTLVFTAQTRKCQRMHKEYSSQTKLTLLKEKGKLHTFINILTSWTSTPGESYRHMLYSRTIINQQRDDCIILFFLFFVVAPLFFVQSPTPFFDD